MKIMREKSNRCIQQGLLAILLLVGALLVSGLRAVRAQGIYIATSKTATYGAYGIIDPLTGAFTLLRDSAISPNFNGYYGMAAVTPGLIYAADTTAPNSLYAVTAQTGASTPLSLLDPGNDILGLAYTNNILFGLNPSESNRLLTINPVTAAATLFADLGFAGDGTLGVGPDGFLYVTQGDFGNGLYRVSPVTGTVTQVNAGAEDSIIGRLFGLGSVNGTLYGFGFDGGIYALDTTTGAATATGAIFDVDKYGTIYAATGPAVTASAAPEPGTLLLLLPVVVVSFERSRKRKARRI